MKKAYCRVWLHSKTRPILFRDFMIEAQKYDNESPLRIRHCRVLLNKTTEREIDACDSN